MKLAALGDIHSNFAALSACLAYIEKERFDGLLLLGDYVSDCPYPQRTMELLHQAQSRFRCWWVRGNREEYLLAHRQGREDGWRPSSQTGSLLYTFEALSPKELDFFAGLPPFRRVELEGAPSIGLCHGSFQGTRELLSPHSAKADRCLQEAGCPLVVCAHSHLPFCYENKGRVLLNGGAVGAPVNGQTGAQFLELTVEKEGWAHRLVTLPYDVDKTLNAFADSGLSEMAIVWARAMKRQLVSGRNFTLEAVQLAEKLAREDGKKDGALPELYWERAAELLNL